MIAPVSRKNTFLPYEMGFDEKTALSEAGRCLSCGLGAQVDSEKCASCLTCLRVCPYQVPVVDGLASMPLEGCQACGICAAFCPANAISLENLNMDDIKAALDAVSEKTSRVLFTDRAAFNENFAENVSLIVLPTTRAIQLEWILRAFENGAAEVVVAACGNDCHYAGSDKYLEGVIARAKSLLESIGIPGARLSYRKLDEKDEKEFAAD